MTANTESIIDRGDAVNLASDLTERFGPTLGAITPKGIKTLADAVLLMDDGIRRLKGELAEARRERDAFNIRCSHLTERAESAESRLAAAKATHKEIIAEMAACTTGENRKLRVSIARFMSAANAVADYPEIASYLGANVWEPFRDAIGRKP